MSVTAMAWAWQQDVSPTDKLILLALADHADTDGICWPGVHGIAEKCRIAQRSVFRAMSRLERHGLIHREPRFRPNGSQASNTYALSVPLSTDSYPPLTHGHPPPDRESPPPLTHGHPPNHQIEPSVNHQKPTPLPPKGENGFDQFWKAYPKKVAKKPAVKAWLKLKPDDLLQHTILSKLEQFKASPDWQKEHGKFIPHPATWLNEERWQDELLLADDDFYPFPTDDGGEA